jgi:hypothetical protein
MLHVGSQLDDGAEADETCHKNISTSNKYIQRASQKIELLPAVPGAAGFSPLMQLVAKDLPLINNRSCDVTRAAERATFTSVVEHEDDFASALNLIIYFSNKKLCIV